VSSGLGRCLVQIAHRGSFRVVGLQSRSVVPISQT
jgi:hypothetical protein